MVALLSLIVTLSDVKSLSSAHLGIKTVEREVQLLETFENYPEQ